MSGHSKWHNIKRRKEVTDAKKGAAFTKFSTEIASAARAGGPDSAANATLRDAIERARKAGFPQTNIDRLLGKQADASLQAVTYEGFGPGGVGLIIVAHTDNTNRTVGQLRTLLSEHGGNLGTPNSVMWKFSLDPATHAYMPKFSPTLAEEDLVQLTALRDALASHPDIQHVFTEAIQ